MRIQKKCALHTYGFHEEFLRRRSKVRNKFIRNLSSTSPSSNIALHSGPRRESCNTLIGVIAKSSGTTNRTPEIVFKINFFIFKISFYGWLRKRVERNSSASKCLPWSINHLTNIIVQYFDKTSHHIHNTLAHGS